MKWLQCLVALRIKVFKHMDMVRARGVAVSTNTSEIRSIVDEFFGTVKSNSGRKRLCRMVNKICPVCGDRLTSDDKKVYHNEIKLYVHEECTEWFRDLRGE